MHKVIHIYIVGIGFPTSFDIPYIWSSFEALFILSHMVI